MAASTLRYVSDWQALFEHRMTILQDMENLYERVWDRSKTPGLGGMIANMRGEFNKYYDELVEEFSCYIQSRTRLKRDQCAKYEDRLDYMMEELLDLVRDFSEHLEQHPSDISLTPIPGKDLEEEWEDYKDEVDRILDECVA